MKAALLSPTPFPCLPVDPFPAAPRAVSVESRISVGPCRAQQWFLGFTTALLGLLLNLELLPIHTFSFPSVGGHPRPGVWGLH